MKQPRPTTPASRGHLHWVFPLIIALAALDIFLSGRDLTRHFVELEARIASITEITRHPVILWLQRGVSVLLMVICLERIAHHLQARRPVPSATLAIAFVIFWLTTVASPALFGYIPKFSHEYVYSLLLGLAAVLSGPLERDRVLAAVRSGLLAFIAVSFLLIPVMPTLVMDTSYSQGLLPGVPRFGGLANHPVGMGMLSQTALLVLWVCPIRRTWLNRLGWTLGLASLFMAQSKTAWVAFMIGAACLVMVRRLPSALERVADPRQSSFGVGLCLGVIGAALALLVAVLVMDLPGVVAGFFDSSQGAQLMSMTGRDRIWVLAMEEWQRNPIFGYGPTIWDSTYRTAIAMPNATHAHNQFMDTLSRAGSVGATGLVIYASVLLGMSVRYARATGGLSLALFSALALQSVSEVPLMMFGYGTDLFNHLLLVVTIAAGAAARTRTVARATVAPQFRTAS